ncbi:MAG: DUF89 family protein [Candidatus Eisenbacteria bacterium]|uniref:DUF89 family protein n=1 Tax=Eiseniibacteriota bacterium TaxID=2212470 RepID=A0A948RXC8_UNCEI|nr:DUF89 family protein [Candidatus Eisenbacteria bacterium]MBU1950912.1 DUF89 family protein [Candidatus Eisenbacteria bacterium]MBU2692595.1 DUF89 family protein [Candidatus Eisenbacteria bacterium]
MRTYLECVACFLRQALDASRMATDDPAIHERVLRATLQLAADMPFDRPPPWMGQQIHRLLREATGNPDPYRKIKQDSNDLALSLYPDLHKRVNSSLNPLATAVSLAIAGNVIDFGCLTNLTQDEIRQAMEDALHTSLDTTAVEKLRRRAAAARDILYLADNAGEIVFDRLLIEQLPCARMTLVVRGAPVINDATRTDAEVAGLSALVPVIDNGSDAPGTILESCSASFQARFAQSDLVIAKGQGNYETLSGDHSHTIFLFMAKCPVAAADAGCRVGERVIVHDRPHCSR